MSNLRIEESTFFGIHDLFLTLRVILIRSHQLCDKYFLGLNSFTEVIWFGVIG